MNLLCLLFLCSLWCYTNAGPFWKTLDQCSPAPTAAATQPTLALATGVWYIYAVSDDSLNEALKCGSCLVWKDGSDYKMQCIVQYTLSPETKMLAYLTGTLTFASSKFTFTAGDKAYEAAVTNYDSTKCTIVAEVCEETYDFNSFQWVKNPVKFGLVKKGAAPTADISPKFDIEQTGCCAVTYDKTKPGGTDSGEAPAPTTTRSPDKIPETCTELGFTAAGARFVKYFAGPKSRADAKTACECLGYKLATVDSDAALTAVKTLLDSQTTKEAWFGLEHTNQANDPSASGATGTYKWCDWCASTFEVTLADGNPKAPATFTKWCAASGDDGTTHYDKGVAKDSLSCFTLDATTCATTFGWRERDCTTTLPYLCECNLCPQCT